MDWQPIETAPKDGVSVLVVVSATTRNGNFFGRQDVLQAVFEDAGWHGNGGERLENEYWHVTHWMPLPTPPVPVGRAGA